MPQPLDRELLAWAAGFFDGEGSTIARTDGRRAGYRQLNVSVPQAGPHGIPAVLVKLHRAMLGVGHIYSGPDGLFTWRVSGRIAASMSLALMWPWLGQVKRAQASVALDIVEGQYEEGRIKALRPRYRPGLVPHAAPAGTDAASPDRAWAAGFLDAEGYFGNPRKYDRKDGSGGLCVRSSVTQHGRPNETHEVLARLQRVLAVGRIERHGEIDDFKWVVEGSVHVRSVLEQVEPWLGEVKRAQAHTALANAGSMRVRGDSERCVRGHIYDRIYVRPDGRIHRICNACDRLRDRAKRAAQGIPPRQFANEQRRYLA